jgi:hypothetical protein
MKVVLSILMLTVTSYVTFQAKAAPHPATSSSAFIQMERTVFTNKQFSLRTTGTTWKSMPLMSDDLFRFSPHEKSMAALSLRTDELKKTMDLEAYAKRWVKDYPQFGFDILGSRPFTQRGEKGLVIDLLHKKKSKQLRQVLFQKEMRVAIFTCVDESTSFLKTLQSCNQIIQSFRWL